MKIIYVLMVCLLTLASCAETEYAEKGLDRKDITGYSDIGFYSLDGVCAFTAQKQYQTSANSKRLTYRLQNQDQSTYIHVQFAQKPATAGQTVKATFTSQGVSFVGNEIIMEVIRLNEGKIWLSGGNVGIVIPVF